MRPYIISFIVAISLASCIVEVELDPPYINVGNIDEYETREIINEIWSGGVLVYEESIYHAWLEIEFQNIGGLTAGDVWAEVIFFNGHREIQTISIYLPNIRSGNTYVYTLETGFESIYDYSDFEVIAHWD